MIKPLQAIASRTMVTSPFANGAKSAKTYQAATSFSRMGEKLNIDCNEMRSVTRAGKKLDLYA